MKLTLDEKMTNELLESLGEIPAKYSMGLIASIQKLWVEQNPKEEVVKQEVMD